MRLTPEEMDAIKLEALGGAQAAADYNAALNALHKFAHSSGCPAGANVTIWFSARSQAYQTAMSEAIAKSFERGAS